MKLKTDKNTKKRIKKIEKEILKIYDNYEDSFKAISQNEPHRATAIEKLGEIYELKNQLDKLVYFYIKL